MDTWVLGKLTGLNKSHDKWTRRKPSASAQALVSFGPKEVSAAASGIPPSPSGALDVFRLWSWCQMWNDSHRVMYKSKMSPAGDSLWEVGL